MAEFNFEQWAIANKFTAKTMDRLGEGDVTDQEDIFLITGEDVARLDISFGQRNRLLEAIAELRRVNNKPGRLAGQIQPPVINVIDPPAAVAAAVAAAANAPADNPQGQGQANAGALNAAGEKLDGGVSLETIMATVTAMMTGDKPISVSTPPSDNSVKTPLTTLVVADRASYNPCDTMYIKSIEDKTLHVMDFLTDDVKSRVIRKRREKLHIYRDQSGALVAPQDEPISYLGLSGEEWACASLRLFFHMVFIGTTTRDQCEPYMSYTVTTLELGKHYEWNSVLNYDARYREMQARTHCVWGTMGEQLQTQLCIPKNRFAHQDRRAPPRNYSNPGWNRVHNNTYQGRSEKSADMCRQWALGHCPFGEERCKFSHVNTVHPTPKN